jgi:endonuclease/exonuclease/phosphatase (EEP) superfamily protein YafD
VGEKKKRDWPVIGSAIAAATLLIAYAMKEDGLAGLTIWPFWAPAVLCLLPAAVSARRANWKPRVLLLFGWLLAWSTIGEEPSSLARSLVRPEKGTLRVVSLNCAGSVEAAVEVVDLKPDIVLLQESMGEVELERLRAKLGTGWSKVVGVDASILARGRLEPVGFPGKPTSFIAAWAHLPEKTLIVSLRLAPPVFRLDYWNPACWRAYADNKRKRRAELMEIVDAIDRVRGTAPVILGGDFNIPPDHTVTETLWYSALFDAFEDCGRGWGATAVNDYPMVRIDQIWASYEWEPVNAYAKKTRNSDHQIAVAEFSLATLIGRS